MHWLAATRAVSLVSYPLLVYFALEYVDAKYLGVALLVVLILRYRSKAQDVAAGFERAGPLLLGVAAAFAVAVWWRNDEVLLRLYPALFNLCLLSLFAYTLHRPPTMIARFARLQQASLSPSAIRYTTRLTWIWCIFFVLNAFAAAYTALYMSRPAWAIYNGFIAYLLIGALWAGEWLFRRYRVTTEPAP
jgi:uncharacterized membrane protein